MSRPTVARQRNGVGIGVALGDGAGGAVDAGRDSVVSLMIELIPEEQHPGSKRKQDGRSRVDDAAWTDVFIHLCGDQYHAQHESQHDAGDDTNHPGREKRAEDVNGGGSRTASDTERAGTQTNIPILDHIELALEFQLVVR
jgi:hypothetical protein